MSESGLFKTGDPRNSSPKPKEHRDKIKESVQAFKDSLTVQDKKIKFKVSGKKVTVKQWKIFETYNTLANASPKETAELCNVSVSYVRVLRSQDWWGELTAEYIDSMQDWFFREMAGKLPTLAKAVVSIWDGTIEEPKLASAIVKSMETFNKMGKRHGKAVTEPLTKSKQDIYLTDNSVSTTHNIQINMAEHFSDMSMEEITAYSKTGEIPQRLNLIDAEDVEEIED